MNKQLKIWAPVFITGLTIAILFSSCYYDRADILYGKKNNNCDTISTVLYSADVVPVLEQKCYGCHAGSSPSGNIAMGNYASDKTIGLNGKLYGSINHASGYSPMPDGEAKMDACTIAIIKKWIAAGCPNN